MTLDDLRKKYPMNARGFTVIPTMVLSPDTMEDWMIGLRVTIGLAEEGATSTDQGYIVKYDEKSIHIKVGSKTKKLEYHPENLVLCVYQFDERILFSNEVVVRKEAVKEAAESTPSTKAEVPSPTKPKPTKKSPGKPKKAREEKVESPVTDKEHSTKKSKSKPVAPSAKKLFGISRG